MTEQPIPHSDAVGPAPGRGVSGRLVAVVIVVAVVAAAVVGRAWFDIGGVRTLPGTALAIATDASSPSGSACGSSLIPPARLVVRGDALALVSAREGEEIPVVWPPGYTARLDEGRGELYDPAGYLVAMQGSTIQERFFGATGADGAFHVCRVASD